MMIDLYARRVVCWAMSDKANANLAVKAVDDDCGRQRYAWRGGVPLDTRFPICKHALQAATVAIPHRSEYGATRKLLG